jgi:hypothetical protein
MPKSLSDRIFRAGVARTARAGKAIALFWAGVHSHTENLEDN